MTPKSARTQLFVSVRACFSAQQKQDALAERCNILQRNFSPHFIAGPDVNAPCKRRYKYVKIRIQELEFLQRMSPKCPILKIC